MASSLFMLLDDIATLLDDVALLTKVAARKTAGVLGDDLALNAQQVAGVAAERELPVVWAVAKGSFVNKLILVPLALVISAVAPWLVVPLLMLGGAFLCFEGMEKVMHKLLHKADDEARQAELAALINDPARDVASFEKDKIKGAIRTDFILSAEIVTIALGTVAAQPLMTRVGVLSLIAIAMTVGVYGLVAAIVKLDDAGFALRKSPRESLRALGQGLIALAPKLMRFLAVAGTAAMFLVGGGIVVHGWPWLHHLVAPWLAAGGWVAEMGVNLVVGMLVGAAVLAVVEGVQRVRGQHRTSGSQVPPQ